MPLLGSCLLFFCAVVLTLVAGWEINNVQDRQRCQALTQDPLDGCDSSPGRTLYVDAVAVASLPNNTETYTILIAPGKYTGQVNVTRPGPTYLLGQTSHPLSKSLNTVTLVWAAGAGPGIDNAFTSTLTIAPNLNASLTGAGPTGNPVLEENPFGCVDFRTYNLDVVNDAPQGAGPALALGISYANGGFYHTGFYSYQDTVFVGKLGNAYIAKSEIAGKTDFLYGFGTCWITHTALRLRDCGGGIAAWKGTNTTAFENKYGVYVVKSDIRAANSSLNIAGKCPLGRPWNSEHRSIFANTYLDSSILSTGFIDWSTPRYNSNRTLQAEYRTYGPGYNATGRSLSQFGVQLTKEQWAEYSSPQKVFQTREGEFGNVGWIDWGV
ncbi:hypothetical protein LZ554_006843 [Drepanopeziza brunnea f. sp. 'monogermtubi']|nr:hypothetical protein LZ554_006843 [Drepanopeziza brunnea f. sp. 'monogermtubi']